jgi:small subunit ribosomal protein S18
MRNNSVNDNSKNKNQRLNSDASSRVTRNVEEQKSSLVSGSSSSLSEIKQSIGNLPTSFSSTGNSILSPEGLLGSAKPGGPDMRGQTSLGNLGQQRSLTPLPGGPGSPFQSSFSPLAPGDNKSEGKGTATRSGARETRVGGNGATLGAEGLPRKGPANTFAPGGQARSFGFQPKFAQGQNAGQKITKNFNQGKGFNQNKFQLLQQPMRRRVLSITQILAKYRKKQSRKKRQKQLIRPLIPPKSLLVMTTFLKAEKSVFNRRIIDYKNAGLLQKYIGIGGKILPRLQTGLTSKQQRYVAKTIKSARIMGLLPFVGKERGFFR